MSDVGQLNDDVVAAFASGAIFGGKVPKRIYTHAAHVFLIDDRAWKLKRAVRYDYLDFSTVQLRHDALAREFALNRRTAPQLYVGLHPITRGSAGDWRIGGTGEALDWVLEMRRFADGDLLSEVAGGGRLTPALAVRVADAIVDFHAIAPPVIAAASATVSRVIAGNAANLLRYPRLLDADDAGALIARQRREAAARAKPLDRRGLSGRVRLCHGDLHLGNIALVDGQPVLFDCLEFSDELATVDVLYDLAFLVMDLLRIGLPTEANMIANRYLDRSPEDEEAWHLFPLFLSLRATVRAHVRAAGGAAKEAQAYLALARAVIEPGAPRVVAIGGRSAVGKSTLARALAGAFGSPPGARVLRSDVLRKRQAAVAPETRLAPTSYTTEASAQVYAALIDAAEQHVRSGDSVILDAAFLRPGERAQAAALAARTGVPFVGIWLDAPVAARLERLAARGPDASDATAELVVRQSRQTVGALGPWHVLDATLPLPMLLAHARRLLSDARTERHGRSNVSPVL